jgi:hypothetical protein
MTINLLDERSYSMSDKTRSGIGNGAVSRRIFLTTGVAGVAAVTAGCVLGTRSPAPPSGAGATSRKPTLSAPFGKSGDGKSTLNPGTPYWFFCIILN